MAGDEFPRNVDCARVRYVCKMYGVFRCSSQGRTHCFLGGFCLLVKLESLGLSVEHYVRTQKRCSFWPSTVRESADVEPCPPWGAAYRRSWTVLIGPRPWHTEAFLHFSCTSTKMNFTKCFKCWGRTVGELPAAFEARPTNILLGVWSKMNFVSGRKSERNTLPVADSISG